MCSCLSDPQPFFPTGPAFGECTQLAMTGGEPDTGLHSGQEGEAEALVALRPFEERYGLPEAVDRSTIGALGVIGSGEVVVGECMQHDIPTGCGERDGALGGGYGLVICAREAEMT